MKPFGGGSKHGGKGKITGGKIKSTGRHSRTARKAATKKQVNTLRDAKYVPGAKGGNGRWD